MPRTCTICTHAERETIDRELVSHRPYRTIADQFRVSKSAMIRHHDEHLPDQLVAAKAAEDAVRADDLLAQVRALQGHALDILAATKGALDYRTALGAIREARGCIELFVKVREGQMMEDRVAAIERQLAQTAAPEERP